MKWQQLAAKHLSRQGQQQCTPEGNNVKEVQLGSDFSPWQASKQSSSTALHGNNTLAATSDKGERARGNVSPWQDAPGW